MYVLTIFLWIVALFLWYDHREDARYDALISNRSDSTLGSTPDLLPRMLLDTNAPFDLQFGRGSGWTGLATVSLDQLGNVTVVQFKDYDRSDKLTTTNRRARFERTQFRTSGETVQRILKLLQDEELLVRDSSYFDDNILDGSQWVFRFAQAGRVKRIYFNNSFPFFIQRFADNLDKELEEALSKDAIWEDVPRAEERKHEKILWNNTKRGL